LGFPEQRGALGEAVQRAHVGNVSVWLITPPQLVQYQRPGQVPVYFPGASTGGKIRAPTVKAAYTGSR
ncbi:MAG: hypothetical protein ACHQ5A_04640, partial [Opitutales bacterium]